MDAAAGVFQCPAASLHSVWTPTVVHVASLQHKHADVCVAMIGDSRAMEC